ncbi:MAG: N-acetylmuramoyl-L-alanine amidase [Novosphingobium sp.]|nr:N-acetylmuramoyl-L-alanine amidase [Novosphingobium sp.]
MSRSLQLALILAVPLLFLAAILVVNRAFVTRGDDYGYVLRIELASAEREVDLPQIEGPQDASRPLVVIDAGHGGHDPGAGNGPVKEKSVTLALSQAIRDQLLAQGGIRVAMTRDEDRYLMLAERSSIARRLGADLFISVHADSAESKEARGASVYVLSEKGSSEAASRFAKRENQADTINGITFSETSDVVGAILLDLSQREAQAGARELAALIFREIQGKMRLHETRVQSAAFAVLKAPDVPSVLFETGYISNQDDAAWLNSAVGRRTISRSTAQAIRVFFARRSGV